MDSRYDLKTMAAVGTAARIGSSIGNELGVFIRDQLEARQRRSEGLPEMEKRIYFQSVGEKTVFTNSVVAIFLALLAKRRRPFYAFSIGVVLSVLVGDRFDRMLGLPARRRQE